MHTLKQNKNSGLQICIVIHRACEQFLLHFAVFLDLKLVDRLNNNTETLLCDEGSISELPYTYKSVGPVVQLLFKTDVSIQRRGYIGSFQAVTNDVYEYITGNYSEVRTTTKSFSLLF